jgi:RHS repeat-associated protein
MTHGNGLATTAGYDLDDRLTSLQVLNGGSAVSSYDYAYGDGMNLTGITNLVAASNTIALWYSPANRLQNADAATGATTQEYIWLPSKHNQNDTMAEDMGLAANDNAPVDLPLAVVNVSATPVIYQVHTDHLGRPIRMTDAAKATIWQATWKPWGEVQSITGAVAQNLRFPGQYFQLETGLAYNWHRTYDPVTGRYTQPDPLRFVDGPAIYQYAMASPFMRTDRDGQEVIGGNGKRDWKLPQCIGCIEWPPKNGGASGDGGTGSNEGGSSGGWLNWLFPPIPQPQPQMCSSPSDEQALAACQAAAAGGDRDWLNFCDASKWAGRVDHTRPQRCRSYVYSTPVERGNFCYNEFGD